MGQYLRFWCPIERTPNHSIQNEMPLGCAQHTHTHTYTIGRRWDCRNAKAVSWFNAWRARFSIIIVHIDYYEERICVWVLCVKWIVNRAKFQTSRIHTNGKCEHYVIISCLVHSIRWKCYSCNNSTPKPPPPSPPRQRHSRSDKCPFNPFSPIRRYTRCNLWLSDPNQFTFNTFSLSHSMASSLSAPNCGCGCVWVCTR